MKGSAKNATFTYFFLDDDSNTIKGFPTTIFSLYEIHRFLEVERGV